MEYRLVGSAVLARLIHSLPHFPPNLPLTLRGSGSRFNTLFLWRAYLATTPNGISIESDVTNGPTDMQTDRHYDNVTRLMTTARLSWNSTGPTQTRTQTPTLGIRLLCTVYVYTRASLTDNLARKIAPRVGTSRRGSSCVSGSWTILARKSARMSVSVSVSSSWNASFTLYLRRGVIISFLAMSTIVATTAVVCAYVRLCVDGCKCDQQSSTVRPL